MDDARITAEEAGKALDALAALSIRLSCHRGAHPDTLVLPARQVHETCSIIDEAVTALKKIIQNVDDGSLGSATSH